MTSTLSRIHVTNSTGLSLNERFTAISSKPIVVSNIDSGRRSRSRSRSVQRPITPKTEQIGTRANQRLLAQLQRKHKMHAALKLKRRSMRTVGGGGSSNVIGANTRIRRGSVKAFRVGVNGKPIRTNSLARTATMQADNEQLNTRNRPLRRSSSSGGITNRLGPRRPTVGGAAQRVARRNLDRQRRRGGGNSGGAINARGRSAGLINRGRSRSRSRTRTLSNSGPYRSPRTRNNDNQLHNTRNRSRSRTRNNLAANAAAPNAVRRGRSRSRSRGRAAGPANKSNLPIKARLGVRPGAPVNNRVTNNRAPNNGRRNASLTRRGVQTGRVQKRRNSTIPNAAVSDNNRRGRPRSRSAVRQNTKNVNVRSRSRSRTRKGQVGGVGGAGQQKQQGSGQVRQQRNNRAPRGRSQQRRGGNNSQPRRGSGAGNNNGKAQIQQRRGRSRSRTGRGAGNRNQGNKTTNGAAAAKQQGVNKDDLDKELDQYMATTKSENEMDFLLKN